MFPDNHSMHHQHEDDIQDYMHHQYEDDIRESSKRGSSSSCSSSPMEVDSVSMVKCHDCGKMVPERNIVIHCATGCRPGDYGLLDELDGVPVAQMVDYEPRRRAAVTVSDSKPPAVIATPVAQTLAEAVDRKGQSAIQNDQYSFASAPSMPCHAAEAPPVASASQMPPTSTETTKTRKQRRTLSSRFPRLRPRHTDNRRIEDENDDDEYEFVEHEVVNLADDSSSEESDVVQVEWSCPMCTLLNPISLQVCNACEYHKGENLHGASHSHGQLPNSTAVRVPDPVRRERLIEPLISSPPQRTHSGLMSGGGALLGSVVGAAGALVRGRSVANGAMEGAMTGAVGGAFVGEVLRDVIPSRGASTRRTPRLPPQTFPTQTIRVTQQPNGRGYTTEISAYGEPDEIMDAFMNSLLIHPPGPHGEMGMSYEQLLHAYGDGTEDWKGADDQTINSLPRETVTSGNSGTCGICLDEFCNGDKRRTLPCFHGFHDHCVDRWLSSNATCPVCKHSL